MARGHLNQKMRLPRHTIVAGAWLFAALPAQAQDSVEELMNGQELHAKQLLKIVDGKLSWEC